MNSVEKFIFSFIAIVLVVSAACSYLTFTQIRNQTYAQRLGAFSAPYNVLQNITHSTTNTAVTLPTLALSRNANRRYARCTNESNGPVFLWLQNFDSNIAASTTVNMNGISLVASSSYEINPDNMWIGDVWVTSTNSGRKINCAEN